MYTAEEFKADIIANIDGNGDFSPQVLPILQNCVFQFNDTNYYTRVIWDTYERNLIIFCAPQDRLELEKHKDSLYSLCTKVHGRQDAYLIMSLEIVAKSSITAATTTPSITTEQVTISTSITIDRATNEIGHGGFGAVYKYYDENKEEFLAIKVFEPSVFHASDPDIMKKRFLREGKKLMSYAHPNVVKAFDYGFLGDESAFIKMEFISGSDLHSFITSNAPLTPTLTNNLCYQYIDAMSYIHAQTDLHRDISYSNIMVTTNNEIKVLDFGFSRNSEDTTYDTEYQDIRRKFVIPTEAYSFRTEVYCIGAVLYTIITGKTFDFYDDSLIDAAQCDSKLKEATKRCLLINPTERFENAVELKKYIREVQTTPIYNDFSLDSFKQLLKNNVELHFYTQSKPTIESIKFWLEKEFRNIVEGCYFQSTVNLLTLVGKIPGICNTRYYTNVDYDFEKQQFIELLNFYDSLSPNMKNIFIRNLQIIILEVSKLEDELPF